MEFPNAKHTIKNRYNAANNLLCINARIEGAMISENLGARITKIELWIKRYGSGSFQGQNGLFRRFWGNSGIFEVVGGFLAQR
jgi:hypothetical protein